MLSIFESYFYHTKLIRLKYFKASFSITRSLLTSSALLISTCPISTAQTIKEHERIQINNSISKGFTENSFTNKNKLQVITNSQINTKSISRSAILLKNAVIPQKDSTTNIAQLNDQIPQPNPNEQKTPGIFQPNDQIPQPNPNEQKTPGIIQPNDQTPTIPQPSTPSINERIVPIGPALPPPKPDPRYLISPRSIDLERADPQATRIIIDELPFTHRSQFEITTGVDLGDQRTTNVSLNGIFLTGASIQESVSKDRVYKIDYRSTYGRVRSLRQQRDIVTSIVRPETALGNRQQISFVADCLPGVTGLDPTTGPRPICSYIPGLKTDETSIDPRTLIPTRFPSTSRFGEIVTPESLAAMRAPGFQAGANGQELGFNLYFPLVGTRPGNSQGDTTISNERSESITDIPTITAGRMRQIVLTNGRDNALGRTIRGLTYVGGDRNLSLNAGAQLLTELLPDAEPSLSPGKKGGSTLISRNLFLAANNNRVPENSFTAYHGGIGNSQSPSRSNRLPTANYNAFWVGLSPIVSRQVLSSTTYQTTGPERITLLAGGEGGIENNVNVIAAIGSDTFNASALTNAYSQVALTFYERDVNTFNSTTLRENTDYHPHVSFTGNTTTANSVLRYYTGAIFNTGLEQESSQIRAYVGGDFTSVNTSGLSYSVAAIGYLHPNTEYYSRLGGNISQRINLGNNPAYNVSLFSGVNYAIDGNNNLDSFRFRSGNSFLNIGATTNLGPISVGANYFIPAGLPNQIESLLSTNLTWRVVDGVALSGYYTPINQNVARSTIGASAAFRLGRDYNSPTLSLSWNRNEIDFGQGASRANYSDNVYGIYFRFGAPSNPFTPPNRQP